MSETCLSRSRQITIQAYQVVRDLTIRLHRRYQNYRSEHGVYSMVDLQTTEEGSGLMEDSEVEHPYDSESEVIRHN
jgi:hypothetical protein